MKRIIIVEDNARIREGFAEVIDSTEKYTITGSYGICEEAIANLDDDLPDLVLMDIDLPGINGIEGTVRIKNRYPNTIVLIITVLQDSEKVFQSLCAGATGYLVKNANFDTIISSIDEAFAGGSPMSLHIARMVVQSFKTKNDSPLSEREVQVLQGIAQGKSYAKLGQELYISLETVRSHIKSIYRKLSVNNRAAVLKIASDNKWIRKW